MYYLEPGSQRVAVRAAKETSLPFPPLAENELRNALRVLHGRGLLTSEELPSAMGMIEEDISGGRLRRVPADSIEVYEHAEELSQRHAARTKCRALDLLHVSHAAVAGIPRFFTGDQRQAELAKLAGLRVEYLGI